MNPRRRPLALSIGIGALLVVSSCGDDRPDATTGSSTTPPTVAGPAGYAKTITGRELLTAQERTVLDQLVAYPSSGQAQVTSAIIEVPPGAETGWHLHEVPLFAHVLEGTLVVTYRTESGEQPKTFSAGDSLLEAMHTPHNARNNGDVPVRLLVVYMGAEGAANVVKP